PNPNWKPNPTPNLQKNQTNQFSRQPQNQGPSSFQNHPKPSFSVQKPIQPPRPASTQAVPMSWRTSNPNFHNIEAGQETGNELENPGDNETEDQIEESNWLNDKIINFYMELIDQRSRQNHKLPTTFSFNTFLYVSLKAGGYTRVKNYTRKTDLFEKDIIFIPIFKAAHWRLITIYIKLQKIEYLDSLGKDGTDILEDIKNYLTEEHNHKKGTPLDTTNWKFTQRTDIPLQQNNDDCGVFVCQYAKSLGSSEEIQIKHSQIPEVRKLMSTSIGMRQNEHRMKDFRHYSSTYFHRTDGILTCGVTRAADTKSKANPPHNTTQRHNTEPFKNCCSLNRHEKSDGRESERAKRD
ncbi:unnamed protein product, partial [Nesidiocoris tenuis]